MVLISEFWFLFGYMCGYCYLQVGGLEYGGVLGSDVFEVVVDLVVVYIVDYFFGIMDGDW